MMGVDVLLVQASPGVRVTWNFGEFQLQNFTRSKGSTRQDSSNNLLVEVIGSVCGISFGLGTCIR